MEIIHSEPESPLNTQALIDAGTIVGDLQLHDMRCFFEVARHKNVAIAAKNLNMGQKDILQAIQALEDSIGARLLDCDSKGTRVTEAGELFHHRHAAPGITQLEHATSLLNPELLEAPTITVGISPGAGERLLPQIISRFKTTYPATAVNVTAGVNTNLLPRLQAGTLSFVLGHKADIDSLRGLNFEQLYAEPVVFVTRCEHPLAQWKIFQQAEIARYPVILPHTDTAMRAATEHFLTALGITRFTDRIETVSYEFARAYAQECDCILVAPFSAVQTELDRRLMQRLPMGSDLLTCPVGITTDPSQPRAATEDHLLGVIKHICPAYL